MQGSVYLLCSLGGGIKRWWASDVCLSDVYVWRRLTSVAYIGSKSRTERPRKTINWHRVSHVTRDSDTTFKVKRPKVKVTQAALVGCSSHQITYLDANNLYVTAQSHYLHGAGAYCGGLPRSLLKWHFPTFHNFSYFWIKSYHSSSGSHTTWQFWRTKFRARQHRFIHTAESQNVPADELYVHLPSSCWTNCLWEPDFSRRPFRFSAKFAATNSSHQWFSICF